MMQISELKGEALNELVARAEGEDAFITARPYSTDWSVGGPLIEREHIAIEHGGGTEPWLAIHDGIFDYGREGMQGPTPLIAAMRCFCASRFGEEVPDQDNKG